MQDTHRPCPRSSEHPIFDNERAHKVNIGNKERTLRKLTGLCRLLQRFHRIERYLKGSHLPIDLWDRQYRPSGLHKRPLLSLLDLDSLAFVLHRVVPLRARPPIGPPVWARAASGLGLDDHPFAGVTDPRSRFPPEHLSTKFSHQFEYLIYRPRHGRRPISSIRLRRNRSPPP